MSTDSTVNDYGKLLCNICMDFSMQILNGRHTGHLNGDFTCHKYKGSSVVDYCIATQSVYELIYHSLELACSKLQSVITALLKLKFP